MGRRGSPNSGNSLSHWYVAAARRVLRPRDGFFVLGLLAHGTGQIAVVLVAAGCARLVATGAVTADVLRICGLGVAAMVARAVGGAVAAHGQARVSADVGAYLRLRVLRGWFGRNPFRRPRQSDHGDRSAVFSLTEGIRALEAGLSQGWAGVLRAIVQLVPLACVLVWLEPTLAIGSCLVLVVFAALLRTVRTRVRHLQASAHDSAEALVAAADDAVRHADVWRAFGAEAKAKARVRAIGRRVADHSARALAISAATSGANEVLAALVLLGVVWMAHAGWLGAVRVERLLPFVVTFFLAYKPLRDWTEAQLALGRARAAWTSMAPLLEASEEAPLPSRSFDLATLDVDAVVLPHGTAQPISLRVAPGRILVVRGPTGAGKTTFLRVLLGLEAQSSGTIRWDGEPLADSPGRARPFAWVPQDAPVLDDSLEGNVGLAGSTDPRAVLSSIGAEHLRDDVRKLSGGERQLVSIARALATDRPAILLDEPTSGLDPDSQALVLRAIERLRGERTIVIVTHRPEPLAIADDVFELTRHAVPSGRSRETRPALH